MGIIQEQHPDRTGLFMQWKQMAWPIMVDSLNLLGVSAVPITIYIDEFGVIRAIRPAIDDLQHLLTQDGPAPPQLETSDVAIPNLGRLKRDAHQGAPQALRAYGDAAALWGGESGLNDAIEAYQKSLEKEPAHGPTHFRLGVVFRKRYDSNARQADDFKHAASHWSQALDINPNQYIWRRRIQQYGPRLDKPYSFYDWVTTAREEINARGETPVTLVAEPGGAEFASPARRFESTALTRAEPDPQGRILRDEVGMVSVETTVVPAVIRPGGSARVHIVFRPNEKTKAHWNNEVGDLVVFVSPPPGWEADNRYLTVSNPPQAVSDEPRRVEFELKSPSDFTDSATLPAYALYYVCEDINGVCLYRRQDMSIRVAVRKDVDVTGDKAQ